METASEGCNIWGGGRSCEVRIDDRPNRSPHAHCFPGLSLRAVSEIAAGPQSSDERAAGAEDTEAQLRRVADRVENRRPQMRLS